jgi:hypothetical protein
MATATITWTTDRPATSLIEWGLTASYGSTNGPVDVNLVTAHSITLSNLNPGTYFYKIHSRSVGGAESTYAATFTIGTGGGGGATTTPTMLVLVST